MIEAPHIDVDGVRNFREVVVSSTRGGSLLYLSLLLVSVLKRVVQPFAERRKVMTRALLGFASRGHA